MPSNAEIIKSIVEAAQAAELEVPETEGKSNAELAEILSGLKKTDKKQETANKLKEAAPAQEEKDVKKPPFSVAPGKAITSRRGILSDGDEIKAEDLAGGKAAITAFVKSGHIVKN